MPSFSLALPPRFLPRLAGEVQSEYDARELEAWARCCQTLYQALAIVNAEWVLGQWEAGLKPACCAKCNGTKYDPTGVLDPNGNIRLIPSCDMLRPNGVADCGSIAACHTGHKIAEAYMGVLPNQTGGTHPRISWADACARYVVQPAPGPDPKRPKLIHMKCNDAGKLLDPTDGMKRA